MTTRDDDAQRSWEREYPINAMLHRLLQLDAENVKAGYLEGYRVEIQGFRLGRFSEAA